MFQVWSSINHHAGIQVHSQQALISVSFIETTAFIEQGLHSGGARGSGNWLWSFSGKIRPVNLVSPHDATSLQFYRVFHADRLWKTKHHIWRGREGGCFWSQEGKPAKWPSCTHCLFCLKEPRTKGPLRGSWVIDYQPFSSRPTVSSGSPYISQPLPGDKQSSRSGLASDSS